MQKEIMNVSGQHSGKLILILCGEIIVLGNLFELIIIIENVLCRSVPRLYKYFAS